MLPALSFGSAGALTPSMVRRITNEILSLIEVPLGFHAHNNLHAAVANSQRVSSGCDSVDACARDMGQEQKSFNGSISSTA